MVSGFKIEGSLLFVEVELMETYRKKLLRRLPKGCDESLLFVEVELMETLTFRIIAG